MGAARHGPPTRGERRQGCPDETRPPEAGSDRADPLPKPSPPKPGWASRGLRVRPGGVRPAGPGAGMGELGGVLTGCGSGYRRRGAVGPDLAWQPPCPGC